MRGIDQLLAIVPHLIGHQPERSLVVVVTRPEGPARGEVRRGSIALTARVDLPPPGELDVLAPTLGPALHRAVREAGAATLHGFCYDGATLTAADYLARLVTTVRYVGEIAGLLVHDVIQVEEAGTRYRRWLPQTVPVAEPWRDAPRAADVPAVADLVLQGRAPLARREDVVAALRRRDEAAADATQAVLSSGGFGPPDTPRRDAVPDEDAALTALGDWVVGGGPAPGAADRAAIVLVLQDTQARDAVLARWMPQTFALTDVVPAPGLGAFCALVPPWPREGGAAALERLVELSGQLPRELTAPPLTMAALLAWDQGQGVVANELCDLALQVLPGYAMARLLRECLDRGFRPPRRSGRAGGRGTCPAA